MNEELEKQIKRMNFEELEAYNNAAFLANNLISILGIGIILLVLNFTNFLTILLGIMAVYSLGNISVGMTNTRNLVKQRMESLDSSR